ncbi:MAG: chemotaxis-specific protein-glutamate methyltransferase CheB [Polyangiaceae bacterium]|nr:chemotaxis-specific protein-glutamate methyltransferase CheB [Polyangiaceae bacterium]MCE7891665.1 chemotaxis-specific protein-glutamate methyltransferase CheB [Sorangiineae bacterium PRO1]MCL4750128.1 chemotaxis-specific protein-glutamate methyltransferase CheB [Myxococcales bacterium]MCL4750672.1 chemotaxis-specific protein-glutamate methyltransferase CheB [Myxococcales bacterium]
MSLPTIAPTSVLVVDDSAYNRRSIGAILEASPDVRVVGKAADGEEALRLAVSLRPDVITLDLEMPKMDGFTFLRILMSKQPTPVIVVSSYSAKENVFRALELGALDFVAKPDQKSDGDFQGIARELLAKVLLARTLKRGVFVVRPQLDSLPGTDSVPPRSGERQAPRQVIGIASSTGGPTALMQVVSRMPARYPNALLVTQHMPDKFTRTFAERLDRRSELEIREAADADELAAGAALVCPGGRCMTLEAGGPGGMPRVRIRPPGPEDRYVPSADRLFTSLSRLHGARAIGVILTGMGDDGVQGARAIREAGGVVVAESDATAIVYGMPGAAVRAGVVSQSMALPEIAEYLGSLR